MSTYLPHLNQKKAILQLVIGAALISFSSVFVAVSQATPTADGVYRMLIGGGLLWLIAIVRRENFWKNPAIFGLQFLAAFFISVDIFLWHKSILYIGPGLSTILVNFQVFFMILVGIFIYGERPRLTFLVAILLAMTGLFLLVGVGWEEFTPKYRTGIYIAFIAALGYTFYIVFLRQSQVVIDALPAISNLGTISILSGLMLALMGLIEGESLAVSDPHDWIWLISYGVLSQVCGWLLISRGLPFVLISLAGLIILLQPGLAFVWDMIFFQRPTTVIDILGVLVTLAGIYLGFVSNVKTKKERPGD